MPPNRRLAWLTASIILVLACGSLPNLAAPTNDAPPPDLPPATTHPATDSVIFNAAGTHAFPVHASPEQLNWSHYHWDDSLSIDIEASQSLSLEEFAQFQQVDVLAPASGIARIADSPLGGMAYIIEADDGLIYYLGHLSSQAVADGSRVTVGDVLGQIGNSGRWAQYIEPHLHMAIASGGTDILNQPADINAAEWIQTEFGLPWHDWPDTGDIPIAEPAAWPLDDATIARDYATLSAEQPDTAGIELTGPGETVYSPLSGQINTHRATSLGHRVQIHNPASTYTIVLSGLTAFTVKDGDIVQAGDPLGTLPPGEPLHVQIFLHGQMIDPLTALP